MRLNEHYCKKDGAMKWHNRAFISFLLVWSFVIAGISGIVLYITPHGRVAYWVDWQLLGLTRDGWTAVHTITGYLFVIASVIHVMYNFRALMSYLKQKAQAGKRHLMEFSLSVVLILIISGATIAGLPPFSTIMDIGESLKESWAAADQEAPVPHAELMTIGQFSEYLGLQIDTVTECLANNGIQIYDTNETIKSIAGRYDVSPADIYMIIQPNHGNGEGRRLHQGVRKYRNRVR